MHKLEKIRSYYLPKINNTYEDYKILGWENSESQLLRFEAFLSNIDIKGYKTFLDIGCGVGTILNIFKQRKINIDYIGVDILPEMIDIALERHNDHCFFCKNIFENDSLDGSFDIVYASGIFNIDLGNNKHFLDIAIEKFNSFNPSIIGFNLLHHHSPTKEKGYFYFSPEETVKIIEKRNLKFRKIEIIEQYLKNDFTVICEK